MFRPQLSILAIAVVLSLQSASGAPLVYPSSPGLTTLPAGPAAPAIVRGFKALEEGDLLAAETALRDAIRLDPSAAGSYIGMAELAARRGQAQQAGNWYESPDVDGWLRKALEVDPNGAYTLRVWSHFQYQRRRFPEAEAALQRAIAAHPSAIDLRVSLAEVQLRGLRNPEAAEATARTSIARNAAHLGARMVLAAALAAQGKADEAMAAFEQASAVAAQDPEPLLALARYQASRGQINVALATLDRLVAALPKTGQAYLDRGDLYLLIDEVPKATESYRAMIKAVPNEAASAHSRLAALFEARRQWAEAEAAYRSAIALEPNGFGPLNNLAFLLASRGERLDDALEFATRAVELAPRVAPTLDTLGWVHRARGDLDKAAMTIERAIVIQPGNPIFHYHLGIVRSEQDRRSEAERSLRRALEIDPKFRFAEDADRRLQQLATKR